MPGCAEVQRYAIAESSDHHDRQREPVAILHRFAVGGDDVARFCRQIGGANDAEAASRIDVEFDLLAFAQFGTDRLVAGEVGDRLLIGGGAFRRAVEGKGECATLPTARARRGSRERPTQRKRPAMQQCSHEELDAVPHSWVPA